MSVLEVSKAVVRYGAVTAVRGCDLAVAPGEAVVVVGPNGAGKTSLMHGIAGLTAKASGKVIFNGSDISEWPAHRIARFGMALVPEGRRIFSPLSVHENLLLGAHTERSRKERDRLLADVYQRFPRLAERQRIQAGLLSGGEQQMLAFGRALMASPRLLILDEPSLGLAPIAIEAVMNAVKAIARSGISILMVEQNAKIVETLDARVVLMDRGVLLEPEIGLRTISA